MFARLFACSIGAAAVGALTLGATQAASQAESSPRWRIAQAFPGTEQEYEASAHGAGDAWITGTTNSFRLDVERWNGTGWQHIAAPAHLGFISSDDPDTPISSSSPGNAWAFPRVSQGVKTTRTYALHWQRGHWATSRLPRHATIGDAAVFSAHDAWAFGTIGTYRHKAPFNRRYNGTRWRTTALPGAPYEVSALAAGNMWAIGPSTATLNKPRAKQITLAMHWNGHAWRALRVPVPQLPRGGNLDDHIAAAGAGDLWVAYINFTRNFDFVSNGLLRWHHGHWQRLRLPPHFTYFLNSAALDGHGGLWVCSPDQIYHDSSGRWSRQHLPATFAGCDDLAWIPGTRSAWASGAISAATSLAGAVLRYGS